VIRSTAIALGLLLALGAAGAPASAQEAAPVHSFAGDALVKADGVKVSQPYLLQLSFDATALTFSAMDGDRSVYTGRMAPKGKKGGKHTLYLDGPSTTAFFAHVAGRAATAAGRAVPVPFAGNAKLELTLKPDGSGALKIKSEVLTDTLGTIVFKANLAGAPPSATRR